MFYKGILLHAPPETKPKLFFIFVFKPKDLGADSSNVQLSDRFQHIQRYPSRKHQQVWPGHTLSSLPAGPLGGVKFPPALKPARYQRCHRLSQQLSCLLCLPFHWSPGMPGRAR